MPKHEAIINEQAEEAVIGCILTSPEAASIAFESVQEEDFQTAYGRKAYQSARMLWDRGQAVDEITVCGGVTGSDNRAFADWLGRAVVRVPSAARVEDYCSTLRETSQRRAVRGMAQAILDGGGQSLSALTKLAAEALEYCEKRQAGDTAEPRDAQDIAEDIYRECLSKPPLLTAGLRTGLANGALDALTEGVQRGQYWIIAARPSMGKSTLIGAIMHGVRRHNPKEGHPLLVTTEMSQRGMVLRALASAAGIHPRGLAKRNLTAEQKAKLKHVVQSKALAGVAIVNPSNIDVPGVRRIAKAHKRKHGLPLLVVDLAGHLQARGASEADRLKSVSNGLAALKTELDCCVIACVQINRQSMMDEDKRPGLHNLKGSGSWEEDADRVLLLHRPAYYGDKHDTRTEIIQAKDRDFGEARSIFVQYDRETGQYENADGPLEG
jgi:replicative DNA helicase